MNKLYPRFIDKGFQPFNPLELARRTEELVCKGDARKYTDFYCVGVYGGIATGYTVGCCLRCVFCWVDWSRDFPERFGKFYTPEVVAKLLGSVAKAKGVKRLRISGGEPTLGKEHLLGVLDRIAKSPYLFILESNGILLGDDEGYANALARYHNLHVRVSIKAGTEEGFQKRTGALGKYVYLPFQGVRNLKDAGVSFHVAVMSDSRLMPSFERNCVIRAIEQIDRRIQIEGEICDPYNTTIERMRSAGYSNEFWRGKKDYETH